MLRNFCGGASASPAHNDKSLGPMASGAAASYIRHLRSATGEVSCHPRPCFRRALFCHAVPTSVLPITEPPANVVANACGLTNRRPEPDFSAAKNFINRELSWLEFNRRVLEEAQDPTQPLLERVKFLGIVSSNLDEFFEIRVAGIKQQIASETSDVGPDGMSPTEIFEAIQRVAHEMVAQQYSLWNKEIEPLLQENNIHLSPHR